MGDYGPGSARRVALVSPFNSSLTVIPPLQLGYLAAALRGAGFEARVFDFKLPGVDGEVLLRELVGWGPGVVGLSCMTVQMGEAAVLVGRLRGLLPGAAVVVGGVHASVLPVRTLRDTGADFVMSGECEGGFVDLCGAVERGGGFEGVAGLTRRDGDGVVSSGAAAGVADLDSIAFPAWDLIPPGVYSVIPWQLYKRRGVVAPAITSRGCPFPCTFCAARHVHGSRLRFRSAVNVVDEMELLVRDYGVEEFQFIDDNFTHDKGHALRVCDEVARRLPGVVWKTPNGIRVDSVDDELIGAMRAAGCYETGLGIESGDEEVLRRCGKRLDLGIVRDKIKIIRGHGVDVYGFFIFGLPGETRESIGRTIRFMASCGLDHVSLSYCVPYPGSAIYDEYVSAAGEPEDWGRFIHYNPFPELSGVPADVLKRSMRVALLRFYLKPGRLLKMLSKMRSVPIVFTMRLIWRYLSGGGGGRR